MAATSVFAEQNWPTTLLLFFRRLLKPLILLAMCGGMFYLSSLPIKDHRTAVVRLREDNFDLLVTSSSEAWLVEFFAPWCPHCQRFATTYTQIAEKIKGIVHVGSVNVAEEKQLKKRFEIKTFPTLLIFSKVNKTTPLRYRGQRTEEAVVSAILQVIDE